MNIRQVLATSGVATMIALAIPGIAAAHNASVAPSCRGIGWQVWNYEKEQVNSIVVTVDGTVVHQDADFKASDTGSYLWTETADHAWSVVVNAPGTQWDKSFSGTWQACVATTTTVPSSTTVVVTTTAPAQPTAPSTTTVVTEPTTTTSVVAVDIPPVPTTVAPTSTVATDISTVNPALPATGIDPVLLVAAFTLVGFGGLVAFAARRKA